jgi:hypothetical protein
VTAPAFDRWPPERRAARAAETRQRWRERFPERAAVRDALLARSAPEPCDRCVAPGAVLFVVDYVATTYLWRRDDSAAAARPAYRLTASFTKEA